MLLHYLKVLNRLLCAGIFHNPPVSEQALNNIRPYRKLKVSLVGVLGIDHLNSAFYKSTLLRIGPDSHLHQKGIEAVEYSEENRSWFDVIPGEKRETIRPALVKDGRLLKKGIVSGE